MPSLIASNVSWPDTYEVDAAANGARFVEFSGTFALAPAATSDTAIAAPIVHRLICRRSFIFSLLGVRPSPPGLCCPHHNAANGPHYTRGRLLVEAAIGTHAAAWDNRG